MVAEAQDWLAAYERIHDTYARYGFCQIYQECATLMNTLRFAKDIGNGICMQVSQGLDTDSFGATAGSLLGVWLGLRGPFSPLGCAIPQSYPPGPRDIPRAGPRSGRDTYGQAHEAHLPVTLPSIRVRGDSFVDEHGRRLMLRGVNLGGSSKVPFTPDGATYIKEGFTRHRDMSFIGRPFPLDQADEHFSRLRSWGMNVARFLVTWKPCSRPPRPVRRRLYQYHSRHGGEGRILRHLPYHRSSPGHLEPLERRRRGAGLDT